jgi:ubiquinone/menaquinone biosynthesis C-methylase UbiE
MVASKAWEWSNVSDERWRIPSEESYYLRERWEKQGYKNFLDLGCGLGRHSILFAEAGFQVEAFDLSDDGIELLREKAHNLNLPVKISKGDMKELPYEDGIFDCLLAYNVIYHTDTDGIKKVIEEIERVLKPGGEFYLTFLSKNNNSYNDIAYRIDHNTVIKMEEPEIGIPHFYTDLGGIKKLLRNFTIIKINHINEITLNSSKWHFNVHGLKAVQIT